MIDRPRRGKRIAKPIPIATNPTAYGYTRKSTDDHRQAITREVQDERINGYFPWRFAGEPVTFGTIFHDDCTSRIKLFERPEGKKLSEILQPGDHLIVAKHDRAFRNVLDAELARVELEARDITLHLLDIMIDTSTALGRAMYQMSAVFAELELGHVSERTAAALAQKRANGCPTNDRIPIGWLKVHKPHPTNPMIIQKLFVPHEEERALCHEIVELKPKMSWAQLESLFKTAGHLVRHTGEPWHIGRIRRGFQAALDGFPLARDRQ